LRTVLPDSPTSQSALPHSSVCCGQSVTRTNSIAFKQCLMQMACGKNQHHRSQAVFDVNGL